MKKVNRVIRRLVRSGLATLHQAHSFAPVYRLTEKGYSLAKKTWLQRNFKAILDNALKQIREPAAPMSEIKARIHHQLAYYTRDQKPIFTQQDIETVFTKDKIAKTLKQAGLQLKRVGKRGERIWVNPAGKPLSETNVFTREEELAMGLLGPKSFGLTATPILGPSEGPKMGVSVAPKIFGPKRPIANSSSRVKTLTSEMDTHMRVFDALHG